MTKVSLGFDLEPLSVPIGKILPSRKTPVGVATSRKFMQIRSSIQEIGLIEPLSVGPPDRKTGQHVLLDGHIRLLALQELSFEEVPCLVARDDEILAHNHPSGLVSPSKADIMLTKTLRDALALVEVDTVDHFIVAGDRYASLAQLKMM